MRFFGLSGLLLALLSFAADANEVNHGNNHSTLLLALAIMVGGAGVSWVVQKVRLPTVIGELGLGMLLAIFAHWQIGPWAQLIHDSSLALLAELGSILLLFEIGLESDVADLRRVGWHGGLSAVVGVIVPFVLGAWLLPGLLFAQYDFKLALFLGASLAATSTGISARVFKDLGILKNPACQIVLTASIIDDILGLIILAMVTALAASGSIHLTTIGLILLQVLAFFILTALISRGLPTLVNHLLRISNEPAMVTAILVAFCLAYAWLAHVIGLATIIGAFVAGLLLDSHLFKASRLPAWYQFLTRLPAEIAANEFAADLQQKVLQPFYEERLLDLIRPLNYVLVPVFFVYAGMQLDLVAVASWSTLGGGLLLAVVAIVSKLSCGLVLPPSINRWIVGFGMVPRGEIGLIFALTGRQLGIFSQQVFAMLLLMVVITSLVTPIALQRIVGKHES